jgi:hypothetical protein
MVMMHIHMRCPACNGQHDIIFSQDRVAQRAHHLKLINSWCREENKTKKRKYSEDVWMHDITAATAKVQE